VTTLEQYESVQKRPRVFAARDNEDVDDLKMSDKKQAHDHKENDDAWSSDKSLTP